ncbi:hypothetical protein TruAng_011523 [Truncatella angustata]|nr:hypothetical protein TruAng_011523 [Truncatella angustata]
MAGNNPDFFIETDEPQFTCLHSKEHIRMLAHTRQAMIGEELSRLASEEYLEDIMQHMCYMEDETLPDENLIDMQQEIQWFMRPFLIDFFIEAHAAFQLQPETLFLTVDLLDRYCSKRVVYKQHYQLVGCAALLIAAKYGEKKDRVPQINELNNMCYGLYDSGMFTQMEMHVLNTLEWIIGHPTNDFFRQLIIAEEGDDCEVEHMAAYICEIALYNRDSVSFKPSIMARASLALARSILQRPGINDGKWDQTSSTTLRTLLQHLGQPSATLSRKYSALNMSRVAITLAEFLAHQTVGTILDHSCLWHVQKADLRYHFWSSSPYSQQFSSNEGLILMCHENVLSYKLGGWQHLADGKLEAASNMIGFQNWLDDNCRDILDECDVTLSVKTQLNYPSGSEIAVDGHPFRWQVIQDLLGLTFHHIPKLQDRFPAVLM